MGGMAEQIFGTLRFLGLYLLAGVMGNAFTLLFTPNVIAAGASTSLVWPICGYCDYWLL